MTELSLNYIQKALEKGESETQIKRFLMMQGISEASINEAFNKIKQGGVGGSQPPKTSADKKDFLADNVASTPSSGSSVGSSMPVNRPAPVSSQPPRLDSLQVKQAAPEEITKKETQVPPQQPMSAKDRLMSGAQAGSGFSSSQQPVGGSSLGAEIKSTAPSSIEREPKTTPAPEASSRLEYSSKKSLGLTFWLIVAIILLVGLGAIGYLYFDEIYSVVFGPTAKEEIVIEEPVTLPVVAEKPVEVVEEEPVVEVVTDPNLIKIDLIKDAQTFLAERFNVDGVYLQTYNIADDPDAFYCYRKDGAHYILGTTLDVESDVLINDLDGSYYCGDVVKDCADPVYCVDPESQ